jgi:hypothetical protein
LYELLNFPNLQNKSKAVSSVAWPLVLNTVQTIGDETAAANASLCAAVKQLCDAFSSN